MVAFNTTQGVPNETQSTDYLRYSRGIDTDKSFADLFTNIGQGIVGGAKAIDVGIQKNIKSDVEDAVDVTNNEFGYGPEAGVLSGSKTPPELQQDQQNLQRLQAAKVQGKVTQAQYWTKLTVMAKELRSKYPGYNDQIDNIIQDVTGTKPAVALRNELMSQDDALRRGSAEAGKAEETYIRNNAEYVADKYPDLAEGVATGKYDPKQVINDIYQSKAKEYQRKATLSQGELDHKTALETYGSHLNNVGMTAMAGIANSIGLNGQTFDTILGDLSKNGATPEQVAKIDDAINQAKLRVATEAAKASVDVDGSKLTPEERTATIKEATANLDSLRDMVHNGDYGIATQWARANQMQSDRDLASLTKFNPIFRDAIALKKIDPSLLQEFILKSGSSEIDKAISPQALTGIITGSMSLSDATAVILNDPKINGTDASKTVSSIIQGIGTAFANPKLTDDNVKEFVNTNMTQEGIAETWKQLPNDQKSQLFNYLTSPVITDRIAKTNDDATKTKYTSFVINMFKTIPDVDSIRSYLQQVQDGKDPFVPQFSWNPNTKQFIVSAPPKVTGVDIFGKSQSDPLIQQPMVEAWQERLKPLNSALANIGVVSEKMGGNPDQDLKTLLGIVGLHTLGDSIKNSVGDTNRDRQGSNAPKSPEEELSLNFNSGLDTAFAGPVGPLLKTIQAAEAPEGFDTVVKSAPIPPPTALTKMTLADVKAYQKDITDLGAESGAVGAYQMIGGTLREAQKALGLPDDTVFDAKTQTRMAMYLLEKRGLPDYQAGKISRETFMDNLAMEWAGLPKSSGGSFYEGVGSNHATTTVGHVQQALALLGQ